jgi:1,5-anhydro-D-fructose reductase (1,5-anhydro-D-mannitol-forming)
MATNVAQAREMAAACDRAGVVLAVNHHMRNAPTLRAMKRLLGEGRSVGRWRSGSSTRSSRPTSSDVAGRQRIGGGGAIFDPTVHDADTLRFLLDDEVEDVVAIALQQRCGEAGVKDSVMGR